MFQAHLLSLFDNVHRVGFHEKNYDQILNFQSQEGETVDLMEPVLAQVHKLSLLDFPFQCYHFNNLENNSTFNLVWVFLRTILEGTYLLNTYTVIPYTVHVSTVLIIGWLN